MQAGKIRAIGLSEASTLVGNRRPVALGIPLLDAARREIEIAGAIRRERPDAVFLLSDGEYPDGTVEAIAKANRWKIPIHCVDLSGGAAGDQLRRIAAESGGRYAPRPYKGE